MNQGVTVDGDLKPFRGCGAARKADQEELVQAEGDDVGSPAVKVHHVEVENCGDMPERDVGLATGPGARSSPTPRR